MRRALLDASNAHLRLAEAHHQQDPSGAKVALVDLQEELVRVYEAWIDLRSASQPYEDPP